MFVIEEAKLPPPTPANMATISSVVNETPGSRKIAIRIVGISSSSALMIVQLRPPNMATAKVYGSRSAAPTSVGSAVSRNFRPGRCRTPGPRNSTITDHRLQTEKPMCSESTEKIRLRLAIGAPWRSQKSGSSGRQSSIQCLPRWPPRTAGRVAMAAVVGGRGRALLGWTSVVWSAYERSGRRSVVRR